MAGPEKRQIGCTCTPGGVNPSYPVHTPTIYRPPGSPDELAFCDEDIQAMFRGKEGYFVGHPTLAQVVKELRLLRLTLEGQAVGLQAIAQWLELLYRRT